MARVIMQHEEIEAFKRSWPCNGLPELTTIEFEFDSNRNLVDIDAYGEDTLWCDSREFDGPALLALSQDAQAKLKF